jgi:hypothetical protein
MPEYLYTDACFQELPDPFIKDENKDTSRNKVITSLPLSLQLQASKSMVDRTLLNWIRPIVWVK